MSKIIIQNDRTLRPWTLERGFDNISSNEYAEVAIAHKRIFPPRNSGGVANSREKRTTSERKLVPKFSYQNSSSMKPIATSSSKYLRSVGSIKQNRNFVESSSSSLDVLPTISRNPGTVHPFNVMGNLSQRPSTASINYGKVCQLKSMQNKCSEKADASIEYPESPSLDIETGEAAVICDQMSSLALDSAQADSDAAIMELEDVDSDVATFDKSFLVRDEFQVQVQRPQTAMPRISSRGSFSSSYHTRDLGAKSKSTPNLFGSSYIREEREKEFEDESMEWSYRRPNTTPGITNPNNLTPYFATQNFDNTKRGTAFKNTATNTISFFICLPYLRKTIFIKLLLFSGSARTWQKKNKKNEIT